MSLPTVEISSGSLTIWDLNIADKLYSMGFYGKPLGVRKATPGQQINRPLSLSYFEGLYLLEKGIIQIKDGMILSRKEFLDFANKEYEDFEEKYLVYKELRELGYVVRPGLKFGTDFIVYEKGPGIDHSKWAVLVEKDDSNLRTINIVRAGRLAHSVRKTFLVATKKEEGHKFFSFTRFKL